MRRHHVRMPKAGDAALGASKAAATRGHQADSLADHHSEETPK